MKHLLFAGAMLLSSPLMAAKCPPPFSFSSGTPAMLNGYRIVTGPDGDSAIEPATLPVKRYPFPGTDKMMSIYDLAPSGNPAKLVVGAADLQISPKPSTSKEMILVLEGSSTVVTPHGRAELTPGTFVIFEDIGAKSGHGGHIGPCGYVGLALSPP